MDAALGVIVFFAMFISGLVCVVGGYLKTFAEPSIVMIPLNVVETLTRTFSVTVRLFANIMSGVFIIGIVGIVLSLAGLLVPIPLMALELRSDPGLHLHRTRHGVHRQRGGRKPCRPQQGGDMIMNWIEVVHLCCCDRGVLRRDRSRARRGRPEQDVAVRAPQLWRRASPGLSGVR